MRKVINKMVTEEDLIRTVAAAYGAGWRQVKLYFMCGLPTETDEDVLQIADLAKQGHRDRPRGHRHAATSAAPSRSAASCPSRTRRSSGPAQLDHEATDARLAKLRDAIRADQQLRPRRSASATTTASPASSRDCSRAATAGSARSSRRSGATAAASTAGASTSPTTAGCAAPTRRSPASRVDVDWYTTREREQAEVLPWDHLDSGLDKDWLWEDWQDALDRDRGRGLPLDPVLRLRRLPADGHRDPDRPDRQDAAAADRAPSPCSPSPRYRDASDLTAPGDVRHLCRRAARRPVVPVRAATSRVKALLDRGQVPEPDRGATSAGRLLGVRARPTTPSSGRRALAAARPTASRPTLAGPRAAGDRASTTTRSRTCPPTCWPSSGR